jgi:hypothetical protein
MDRTDRTERLEIILIYAIIFGVIVLINGIVFLAIVKAKTNNITNTQVPTHETYRLESATRPQDSDILASKNTLRETKATTNESSDTYSNLNKEIEDLKKALATERTVEYVVYSVVDYEGGAITYDEIGGTTKYGIASNFHPDINVYSITRKGAFNILYARYYLPNRLYKFQSVRIQVALMHMCVLFGNRAFTIAYSTVPKEKLINLRDSDEEFPAIVEQLRISFKQHAMKVGIKNQKYLRGWLNRIEKVFYIG